MCFFVVHFSGSIKWNVQTQVSAIKATSRTLLNLNCLTLFYSNPMQTWLKFESLLCISNYQSYMSIVGCLCLLFVCYFFLFDLPYQMLSFKQLLCMQPPLLATPSLESAFEVSSTDLTPLRPEKKNGDRGRCGVVVAWPLVWFCFVSLISWWILC